jgi:outer membrane protein assembly factor BamA
MGYQKFPDSYWGIGPDTEDDAEEKYTPEVVEARLLGEFEVRPGLRLGGQYRYRREVILEKEEDGKLQDRSLPGSSGGTTAGIGVLGSYDSRDNRFSSYEGWYLFLSYTSYGRTVLSDYPYNSVMFDARKFIPVFGSHVFAARFYSRNTWGTVPFQDMPYLGGPSSMRGYQAGRYRDKFAAYAQAEYRLPLIWVTSLAVFGSVGNVSENISSFSFDSIKYAGGAGIRFRLNKERFAIRFDYAVTGEGGSNFYISANEAF